MHASIWLPIIAGVSVFIACIVALVGVVGYVTWRYFRRKWRAFHSHGLVVGATALWDATSSGRLRPRPHSSSDEVSQWTARRVRKEMWRSVDQAEAAVRAATVVGAPTASLPVLCHRLRDAAIGLDRVLRVESAGVVPTEVANQAKDVMQAASDVQRVAVASASDANGLRVQDLTRDTDHEIRCLDAGLASVKDALAQPHH